MKKFIGLGGAGVWWPRKVLARNDKGYRIRPLSVAEKSMALHTPDEDGVPLHTKIGGFAGSSTRTELAAGIIALCAEGPVHIGSDSQVFVDGANWYVECIRHHKKHNTIWKLKSDGNLWETSIWPSRPKVFARCNARARCPGHH